MFQSCCFVGVLYLKSTTYLDGVKKKCVIFWLCGCSVSNLKHCFAEMLFL